MTAALRWADVSPEAVDRGEIEARDYETFGGTSRPGRTTYRVRCPFCSVVFDVYPWSLAGTGKRCSCGALLGASGVAYRRRSAQ